jgi:hypothetical protein
MADAAKAIATTMAEPLTERRRVSLLSCIRVARIGNDIQCTNFNRQYPREIVSLRHGHGHNRQAGQLEFPVDLVCSPLGPPLVLLNLNRFYLLPPLVAAPIEHDDMTYR